MATIDARFFSNLPAGFKNDNKSYFLQNGVWVDPDSGTFQLKGGTTTELASSNYVPAERELIVEVDTGKIKVGDGQHSYSALTAVKLTELIGTPTLGVKKNLFVLCSFLWENLLTAKLFLATAMLNRIDQRLQPEL